LPCALVQNSFLANDHKHKTKKIKIVTSNGLTKHNEKEKMTISKKNKAQMKCSIAMLMDKRNNLSIKCKDYSGFGIL
jgi:hypothetical protein